MAAPPLLSGRALGQLNALQGLVHRLAGRRSVALRLLHASRRGATTRGQLEFWRRFTCAEEEYRQAVRRLAQFCAEHRQGSRRGRPAQERLRL